jgi:hypothetical protein
MHCQKKKPQLQTRRLKTQCARETKLQKSKEKPKKKPHTQKQIIEKKKKKTKNRVLEREENQ